MMRLNPILIMKNNFAKKIVHTLLNCYLLLLCFDAFASRYFFGILLIFASFLQTYYDIYFFHILSFYSYLLQIGFYIYLLLAFLIFHYCFYTTLFLYLVLYLCFFDSRLYYPFLYIMKKTSFFYKALFLSIKLELGINFFCFTLTNIQKINSICTS